MSKEIIKDGVVSIFNPNQYTPVWREIPGFSNYEACDLGVIRRKNKKGFRYNRLYCIKTTVGTYLRVSAVSDDRQIRSKEVHHLVCLAFHGKPPQDGQRYEVNHKDGNKHNNHQSNLEWMTRGENLIHAYKSGLRKDNQVVRVYDEKEGRVYDIYSISEVGRQFDLTLSEAWTMITNHTQIPYRDRYTFSFVKGNRQTTRHRNLRAVMAFNYKNNQLIMADHLGEMEVLTGIKRGTILWNLKRDNRSLINGHIFAYADDKRELPTYTYEEVEQSIRVAEKRKKPTKKHLGGVFVKDYINNKILDFPTVKAAATHIGSAVQTLNYHLKKPDIIPINGFAFKYKDDPREFPELTPTELSVLLRSRQSNPDIVYMTDLELNTTTAYSSLSAVADKIGISIAPLCKFVKSNPGKVFENRYLIGKL